MKLMTSLLSTLVMSGLFTFAQAEECKDDVRSAEAIAAAETALKEAVPRSDNPYQYGLTLIGHEPKPKFCSFKWGQPSIMEVMYDFVEVNQWGDGLGPEGEDRLDECHITLEKYSDTEWRWVYILCDDIDVEKEN